MRLVLVDNLLFEGGLAAPRFDPQPHLGLMSLAAVAAQAGHATEILDPRRLLQTGALTLDPALYAALARRIADARPGVVGFTALGCNFHCVVQTAQALRVMQPDLPILLGGPHATILHREVLEAFACFDIVVRHEAEDSLPRVLTALESGGRLEDIPGVTFRAPDGTVTETAPGRIVEDLDRLPVPDYGSYPLDDLGLTEIRIEAGRGCPFSCTFCSTATFFGRRYRLKSPARIVAEMDRMAQRHGFTRFKLNHDLFTVNRDAVAAFCDAVAGRGYEWSCSARMDCVDDDLLERMARAGCRDIYFGVEAGSARMQEITRKRLDLALMRPRLDTAARLGVRSTTSFITGYPEEGEEDLAATLDAVGAAHLHPGGLNVAQLHLLSPEPGTALMRDHGDRLRLDAHVSEFNFPRLGPGDDTLLAAHPVLFANHHHFETRLPRDRLVFVTSLWPVLYALDRAVLTWLLRPFGGRLSGLANGFCDWARHQGAGPTLGALAAFLADHAGTAAPATSVARLAAARAALANAGTLAAEGPADALRLSPAARLLTRCHDVSALLKGRDDTDRSDWLLLREGDGALRHYALGPGTAALLRCFETPARYADIARRAIRGHGPVPAPEDIAALIEMGALVRCRPAAGQDAA